MLLYPTPISESHPRHHLPPPFQSSDPSSTRRYGPSARFPPLASSGLLVVSLNFGVYQKGGLPDPTRDALTQSAQDTKPPFGAARRSHVYPSQHWGVVGCATVLVAWAHPHPRKLDEVICTNMSHLPSIMAVSYALVHAHHQ